ncbi:HIT domain-containing protein [Vibrio sp. SCSIO 43137]|uniref:HIT domain-containing protein n=1 Tax=Vibrio sp. SCSIO 43137 TaxID=3021011 RepID=UPI0023081998|nr:HIT domain-containing protein [Vibrio sp. SCSIO 43137]WCE28765.1 HIT domain-containing protein [Vibrio sp. SCSIO 43137]
MTFTLHPQLEKDTTHIGDFPLCKVLLSRDDSVPWLILVPKVDNLRELHHLPMEQQQQFLVESQQISKALETLFSPDKLNLGALGNMVPQLHIHHVARFTSDIAWPGPIWGSAAGRYREEAEQAKLAKQIAEQLTKEGLFQSV